MGFNNIENVELPKTSAHAPDHDGLGAGAPEQVQQQPAPKAAAKQPEGASFRERAAKDLPFLKDDGFDNGEMGTFLSEKPHVAEREYIESEDVDLGPDGEPMDQETMGLWGWFKNAFSKAPHSPEKLEAEMGGDLDGLGGKMFAEMSDLFIPGLIGKMKDKESAQFKADAESKEGLENAWNLYLRSKRVRVTPGFFLLYSYVRAYGINAMSAMAEWIGRVQLYGWHMPWSDAWKLKAQQLATAISGKRDTPQAHVPQPAPVAPQPQPAPVPQYVQPQPVLHVVQPEPSQTLPPPPPALPKRRKICLETGKTFDEGSGFPKTAKNPDFVDAFIDKSAFVAYRNRNNLLGDQVNRAIK